MSLDSMISETESAGRSRIIIRSFVRKLDLRVAFPSGCLGSNLYSTFGLNGSMTLDIVTDECSLCKRSVPLPATIKASLRYIKVQFGVHTMHHTGL